MNAITFLLLFLLLPNANAQTVHFCGRQHSPKTAIIVHCFDSEVTSLKPVAKITNVYRLSLRGTGIRDVKPLRNLKRLFYIVITKSQVTDITPLANVKSLGGLVLEDVPVTDVLATVLKLPNLMLLSLIRTKVPPSQIKKLKKLRPKLEVEFQQY